MLDLIPRTLPSMLDLILRTLTSMLDLIPRTLPLMLDLIPRTLTLMLDLIPETLTSTLDLIPQFVRPHNLASVHLMQTYKVTWLLCNHLCWVCVLIILAYTWVIFIVVSVIITHCVFKLGKEESIKLDFLSLTTWSVKLGSGRGAD